MRYKISNIIWGLIFIFIGIAIGGKIMGVWDFNLFFKGWWTLFIIIPCLASMIKGGINTGNAIGLLVGIFLLLSNLELFSFSLWDFFVPAILIIIGLVIILRGAFHRPFTIRRENRSEAAGSASRGSYSAVFSGNDIVIDGEFTGANLDAIFGGLTLDLRDAKISGDVEIKATAVFGGMDIYVPQGVNVKINNVPIFGGVSNKTARRAEPGAPVIYLHSTCMFGGIDIK
jgi:predicted membrane protein